MKKDLSLKQRGQSVVEFTLAITLAFLMFSAVVDIGQAYFVLQGLAGGAQEGAQYASFKPSSGNAANDAEIRNRVANEAGTAAASYPNLVRFVNLRDLNNDGQETAADLEYITVASAPIPGAPASTNCSGMRTAQFCEMIVTVNYDYKPFFVGASLFSTDVVQLSQQRRVTIGK